MSDESTPGSPSGLDRPFCVTFFTDRFAQTLRREDITLRALAERAALTMASRKEDLPWMEGAEFGSKRTDSGSYRHDGNVVTVSAAEADYDGEKVSVEQARQRLADANVLAFLYTSPSHTPERPRWRIIAPTSRPLPPAERADLVARLNGLVGGVLAPESFRLSQAFFYGHVEGTPHHEWFLIDGRPIDVCIELDEAAQWHGGLARAAATVPSMTLGQRAMASAPSCSASQASDAETAWQVNYRRKALHDARIAICSAADGEKRDVLNRQSFSIGTLAGPYLAPDEALGSLLDAFEPLRPRCRNPAAGEATIRKGFAEGMASPREIPPRPAAEPLHPGVLNITAQCQAAYDAHRQGLAATASAEGGGPGYGDTPAPAPASIGDVEISRYRLDRMTEGKAPLQQFLLQPYMPLGTTGLLIAAGGTGKSLTALELCLCVARRTLSDSSFPAPGPFGGTIPLEAAGATVFLTLEDDTAEIHRRAEALDPDRLRDGLPCYVIPAVDLPNFDPSLVVAVGRAAALTSFAKADLDTLLENAAQDAGCPVRLLVLDPAGDFLNGDENDATFVKLLMRRLREASARHGCTILLLGHVAKSADPEGPSMRGSSAWVANSRFAISMWRPVVGEAKELAARAGVPADALVWVTLLKANHAGAPVGRKRLLARNPATGRLQNITDRLSTADALDEQALLALLVECCREYAEAGLPFAHTGQAGLWSGRADLPPPLSDLSKHRLEALGAAALQDGRLVKARTTSNQVGPKYLDIPDGPLSRGVEITPFQGSRREALARLRGEDAA